jgi:hypothetical protein
MLAYCTNVHAGAGLTQTWSNLERYATAVKARYRPGLPMGIGLWLSARAVRDLAPVPGKRVGELAAWLREQGLIPFTFNGFPYGDFHQPVVKHQVYRPTWYDASRLAYTRELIRLLDALAPPGVAGSISTLPVAWREPGPTDAQWQRAACHLRQLAQELRQLEDSTGRLIYVCLEPEPGCVLQRGADLIDFCRRWLWPGGDERTLRRYIRACHDICHGVVMDEDQAGLMADYRAAGLSVGKVQVSSAVCVPFEGMDPVQKTAAWRQLLGFAEDRYLHQTTIQPATGAAFHFFDDLPAALRWARTPEGARGTWRVHFHVPVYLEAFGLLRTSQGQIEEGLRVCRQLDDPPHFEVETYAWEVLPEGLREPDLARGIAREMLWTSKLLEMYPSATDAPAPR